MRHGRVDANQGEIVGALRAVGCAVCSLADLGHGFPDLLVWHPRRGYLLVEVKMPGGKLTADERAWHAAWPGQIEVWHGVDEAFAALGIVSSN